MTGTSLGRGGRVFRGESPEREAKKQLVEVGAIIAVGAAALAFVAGVGTYLYIRFTQNRKQPPQ